MSAFVSIVVRLVGLGVLLGLYMTLVVPRMGEPSEANIGAGLIAFGLVVGAAFVWALLDARRRPDRPTFAWWAAVAVLLGVGWVVLFEDPVTQRLTNHWISVHQNGVPTSFKPLLVMDVWEHAFMRDYRATERARYVEAFFANIDWAMVERRFREAAPIRPARAA